MLDVTEALNRENQLATFSFEENELKTIRDDNNNVWFVANHVCKMIGLSICNGSYAHHLKRLDSDEKLMVRKVILNPNFKLGCDLQSLSAKAGAGVWLINESGLYALIMRSNMPKAKQFRKWVTSEVLPTIRKMGSYSLQEANSSIVPIEREFRAALNLAKAIGLRGEYAVLSANKLIKQRIQVNCLEILDVAHLFQRYKNK